MTAIPELFVVTPEDGTDRFLSALTNVQRAQLDAALSYHALINPGTEIVARIAIGGITQVPALTDSSTVDGRAVEGLPLRVELRARSMALGRAGEALVSRWIRLGHPDASPATTRAPESSSVPRKVYRQLERRGPIALDEIREFLMRRRERAIAAPLPRYPHGPYDGSAVDSYAAWPYEPAEPPRDDRQAVLFGLHWLQTGGAERWAVESIQLAKEAGFLPVVVTDQNSVHPWAERPELEGCVLLMLSFDHHAHELDIPFTHALLENFNLAGVMLHHSNYLYQMLPWIKRYRPQLPIVDSLHIVEYLGGGYPGTSVHFDEFIDTHHVISPQLVEWMADEQAISREKLALAPLTALTVDTLRAFKPRDPSTPFTIAYIGRLSRQKRPDVFLGLVHWLKRGGMRFRAIMQGDGELRSIVDGLLSRFGLEDIVEQRLEDVPVADTLAEADLLVVTSINEGLTLTTLEAVASGIPVVSTNVGSQRTVVQDEALFPRPARQFIPGTAKLIKRLDTDEHLRELIWSGQQKRVVELSALPTAHQWMKEYFASWQA